MKIFQIGVNDQVKTAIKFSKHFTHTYTLNLEGTAMQPSSTDNRFFNITVNFLFPDEKVHTSFLNKLTRSMRTLELTYYYVIRVTCWDHTMLILLSYEHRWSARKLACEQAFVVQFYPWFKFIFLCFKLIIINYQTPTQREIKFKPRIKLNHNSNISFGAKQFWKSESFLKF